MYLKIVVSTCFLFHWSSVYAAQSNVNDTSWLVNITGEYIHFYVKPFRPLPSHVILNKPASLEKYVITYKHGCNEINLQCGYTENTTIGNDMKTVNVFTNWYDMSGYKVSSKKNTPKTNFSFVICSNDNNKDIVCSISAYIDLLKTQEVNKTIHEIKKYTEIVQYNNTELCYKNASCKEAPYCYESISCPQRFFKDEILNGNDTNENFDLQNNTLNATVSINQTDKLNEEMKCNVTVPCQNMHNKTLKCSIKVLCNERLVNETITYTEKDFCNSTKKCGFKENNITGEHNANETVCKTTMRCFTTRVYTYKVNSYTLINQTTFVKNITYKNEIRLNLLYTGSSITNEEKDKLLYSETKSQNVVIIVVASIVVVLLVAAGLLNRFPRKVSVGQASDANNPSTASNEEVEAVTWRTRLQMLRRRF